MKKYCIFLTVFVLTISMFTGCGCTPQNVTGATAPTRNTAPAVPETTMPATMPTVPTEQATVAPDTTPIESGMGSGNAETGVAGDITDATTPDGGTASGSRRMR